MFPAAAVVDPDVLSSLPPKLVAYTGVDALTHALEATLSGAGTHNPVSDALAEDAAALLLGHLRAAASGGGDQDSRAAVMRASTLAGLAFGSADVGAVHCLSETLGGLFDVPHGLGNAIFLAATLRHHLAVEDGLARSSGRVRAVLGRLAHRCASDAPLHVPPPRRGQEAECFVEAVDKLCADLRIPKYAELKIAEHDLARIVRMSVENGSNGSNPNGPLNADEYLSIMARS
jgi:alcohol dehydrogenase